MMKRYFKNAGKFYSVEKEIDTTSEKAKLNAEILEHEKIYENGLAGLTKRRDEAIAEIQAQILELDNL